MQNMSVAINSESEQDESISSYIWKLKYQRENTLGALESSVDETWIRVAECLSRNESPSNRKKLADRAFDAMSSLELLPAGRILAGAGTNGDVTLSNTFVMRPLPNDLGGVLTVVGEAARTMQMGGGIGIDFSTLSPKGNKSTHGSGPAAGPIAAMAIFDTVCEYLVTSSGRGAMMATLRCDHPDIEDFITSKGQSGKLRNFNVSVLVTDRFMEALLADAKWDLQWNGQVTRRIEARALWNLIMGQTYGCAEPGVLFIDRINEQNPLGYIETISATNSCAEQPLPPNGTCPLASINLARLAREPFTDRAHLDLERLRELTSMAVRLLDNTIDASSYPLHEQMIEAKSKRRVGLGVTGLADALVMVNATYGSPKAVDLMTQWLKVIKNEAYKTSALIAGEKGQFLAYDAKKHLTHRLLENLEAEVVDLIHRLGLRNGSLTTIAPVGTTSLLAENVSSGIEPIFSNSFKRIVTERDGSRRSITVTDYAVAKYREALGDQQPLNRFFVTAKDLEPHDHLAMQSAAQRWIDSGISKTVNCPAEISFSEFEDIYLGAYDLGCKGCTTFRPNEVTGSVLMRS